MLGSFSDDYYMFNLRCFILTNVASGGPSGTLKSWKINLNANDNFVLAA